MHLVLHMLTYAGVCGAAVGGTLGAAALVLLPAGLEVLPKTSGPEPSARITSWLEREAVAMPDLPRPHGPPLTREELHAYAERDRNAEPVVRVPIVAMTESDSEPVRERRRTKRRPRITVHAAPTTHQQQRSPREYVRTARERYAPERNY